MSNFKFRPYGGIRISRRGIRPYMGIGCLTPVVFGLLLLVLLAAGCGQRKVRPPVGVLIAIDTSGSARPDLSTYAHLAIDLVVPLNPSQDRVGVYRFDAQAAELYEGHRPKLLEAFEAKLAQDLSEAAPRGTSPARALEALALAADRTPVDRLVLVILTDGGNDDFSPEAPKLARAAAERLARHPRVAMVVVAGAKPGRREALRALFEPLGAKLRFADLAQAAEVSFGG